MRKIVYLLFGLLLVFFSVSVLAASFIRGDANQDGEVDISDSSFIFNWLFLGGSALQCMDAADTNDDGVIDISDGKYLLGYLYSGENTSPPQPYPLSGIDPTSDKLDCRGENDSIVLNKCQVIDKPGNYILERNMEAEGTCFEIKADNVNLDCMRYRIKYSTEPIVGYGIHALSVNSTSVRNCNLSGNSTVWGSYAIYLEDVNDSFIINNKIVTSGFGGQGVSLFRVSNSYIINNGISTGIDIGYGPWAYGIYLLESKFNRINNNTVVTDGEGSSGIFLESSFYSKISNNNITTGCCEMQHGIYLLSSDFNIIENNGVTVYSIDSGYGLFLSSSSNIVVNNTINTYGQWGLGVLLQGTDNRMINNTIRTYGESAHGVLLGGTESNILMNLDVETYGGNSYPLFIEGGNNLFIYDSFFNSSVFDSVDIAIPEDSTGVWNFVNVNFDKIIFNGQGILNRYWYLDMNVKDNLGNGLKGAIVKIFDKENNLIFSGYTDSNGKIPKQSVLLYTQNFEVTNSFTPHKIVVFKLGYKSETRFVNMNNNRIETFILQKL